MGQNASQLKELVPQLRSNIDDHDFQVEGMSKINDFARTDSSSRQLAVKYEAIQTVLASMEEHTTVRSVQAMGFETLATLLGGDESGVGGDLDRQNASLYLEDIIDLSFRAIKEYKKKGNVIKHVFRLLSLLGEILKDEATEILFDRDILSTVMSLMKSNSKHPEPLWGLILCLGSLAMTGADERSQITSSGALEQALSLMEVHSDDSQVSWAVCRLISFVVLGSDENKATVVEKDGIQSIVKAISTHGNSSIGVMEWGCLALSNLTAKSETYAETAQKENAVHAVSAVIRSAQDILADLSSGDNTSAQTSRKNACLNALKNGCFALAALMAKNEEARIEFTKEGVAGNIIKAMLENKLFAPLQQHALAALANASMYPQAIVDIVRGDGILAITKALRKHPGVNGVQIEGSRAISLIVKNAPLVLEEVKHDEGEESGDESENEEDEEMREEGIVEANDNEEGENVEDGERKSKKKKKKKGKKKEDDEDANTIEEEEEGGNEEVENEGVDGIVVEKKKKKKAKKKGDDNLDANDNEEENVEESLIKDTTEGTKKKSKKKKKKTKKAEYEEHINSEEEDETVLELSLEEGDGGEEAKKSGKKSKKSKKAKDTAIEPEQDEEQHQEEGEGAGEEEGGKTKKSKKKKGKKSEANEEAILNDAIEGGAEGEEDAVPQVESKKKRKKKKKKSKKRAKDEVEESLIQSMSQDYTSSVDEAASRAMSESVYTEEEKKRTKEEAADFIANDEAANANADVDAEASKEKAAKVKQIDETIETTINVISRPSLAAPIKEPVLFNELCDQIRSEETYAPIISSLKSHMRDGDGHVYDKVLEALDNLLDSTRVPLGKDCISGINAAMRDPEGVCDGCSAGVASSVQCHAVSVLSKALRQPASTGDRAAILKSNFVTWVVTRLRDLAGSDPTTLAAYCAAAERIGSMKLFNEDDKVVEALVAAVNSHKDRAEVIDAGLAAVAAVCHTTQAPWAYTAATETGCVSLCVSEVISGKRALGSALACLYLFLVGRKDDALKNGCKDTRLVPAVIKAVRTNKDDKRIAGYGLGVLYLLAAERDKAKRALIDGGGLSLAQDVVRASCDVSVLTAAYRTILVIAQSPDVSPDALAENELLPLLIDTLLLHGDLDEPFAEIAYITLANIATRSPKIGTELAKAGAVKCALAPLRDPTIYERKTLVANAISLIGALATMRNDANKALIVKAGAIADIIRTMDILDDNELVLKNGCSALGLLCYRYADKIEAAFPKKKKKDNCEDNDEDFENENGDGEDDDESGKKKNKKKAKRKHKKKKKHASDSDETEGDGESNVDESNEDGGENNDEEEDEFAGNDIDSIIDAICRALNDMPSSKLVQSDGCRALGMLAHEQPAVARAVMDAGGLELVFAALKNSAMSVQVQESTTYALLCFATVDESDVHAAIAAEERLTDKVVAVARAHPQSTAIQKSVCLFLSTMEKDIAASGAKKGDDDSDDSDGSSGNEGGKLGLTATATDKVSTPVALLIDTLRKNMDDQNVVYNTLKSLVYLLNMGMNELKTATAADPSLANKVPRGSPLSIFFAEGGAEVIVQIMNTFVADVRIQEYGCAVFAAFTESKPLIEEAVKALLAEDACVIFIEAVRAYPTSATIQRAGCSVLGMYCRSKVWTECIALLGPTVVPLVLQAITAFVADKNVLKACLLALFVMVTHSDALLKNIVNFGGINIVVNCMLSCATSAGVQEYGCLFLSNVALKGEQYVSIIATAGGVTANIQALQAYAKFPGVQKNALQLMAVLTAKTFEENRVNFASMGGLRFIKDAFANFPDAAPIIRYGLLAFANMAYSSRAMADVVPAEVAEMLVGALSRFEGVPQVVSEAVRAVSKIAMYPPIAAELLARGAVKALLNAIKRHSRVPLVVQYAALSIGCLARSYVEKSVDEEALAKSLAALDSDDGAKKKQAKKGKKEEDDADESVEDGDDGKKKKKKKKSKKGKKKHGKKDDDEEVEEEEEEEAEEKEKEVEAEDIAIGEIEENYFLGEKGIDLLISIFNASLNIIIVQESIMRALSEVSKTSKRDKAILEHKKNILKMVMDMILRFDKSEPIKATGFDVIAVFCTNNEVNAAKAVSLDGPRIIVSTLLAMRGSPSVCKNGSKALAAIMGSAKEAAAIVYKAGGLTALGGAMKQYPTIPVIQECCCAALSRLVLAGESVAATVAASTSSQDGALYFAVSAMKLHCIEPGVQAEGCALISSLAASSERCRELLVKANCPATVIEALRRLPSSRVQENGCKALANIAACKDPACAVLGINGGIKIVLAAMRKFPQNSAIQESCCLAIANMVARNEHCTACVIAENGVATIVAGMTELEANPIVQKNGCFAFAAMASKCSEQERSAIIAAGALQRVFYAMRQYLIVDPIQRYGLLALNNLAPPAAAAAGGQMAPWYIADESLGALAVTSVLGAMTGCPQQQFIQAEGCKALLKFVAKSDKNALVALTNGGPRAILAALPLIPVAQTVTKAIMALSKLLGVAKLGAAQLEPLEYVSVLLRCGIAFSGDENIAKTTTKCFELLTLSQSDAGLIVRAVKSNATIDPATHFVVVVALQALTKQNPKNAQTLVEAQPDAFVDAFATLLGTSGNKALLEQTCGVLASTIQHAAASPALGQLKPLAQAVAGSQQRLGLDDAAVKPLLALL